LLQKLELNLLRVSNALESAVESAPEALLENLVHYQLVLESVYHLRQLLILSAFFEDSLLKGFNYLVLVLHFLLQRAHVLVQSLHANFLFGNDPLFGCCLLPCRPHVLGVGAFLDVELADAHFQLGQFAEQPLDFSIPLEEFLLMSVLAPRVLQRIPAAKSVKREVYLLGQLSAHLFVVVDLDVAGLDLLLCLL
jgi:hypothetical protein